MSTPKDPPWAGLPPEEAVKSYNDVVSPGDMVIVRRQMNGGPLSAPQRAYSYGRAFLVEDVAVVAIGNDPTDLYASADSTLYGLQLVAPILTARRLTPAEEYWRDLRKWLKPLPRRCRLPELQPEELQMENGDRPEDGWHMTWSPEEGSADYDVQLTYTHGEYTVRAGSPGWLYVRWQRLKSRHMVEMALKRWSKLQREYAL